MCVCVQSFSHIQLFETPTDCSLPGSFFHAIYQARNTGVGCYFLLQRISLAQGSSLNLLNWQVGSLPLSHLGIWYCMLYVHICVYTFVVIVYLLSPVQLFCNPWVVTPQAPLSMECSRQEYWSSLPFPSLGNLPNPGAEPVPPTLEGRFFTAESPGKSHVYLYTMLSVYGIWTFKSRFLSLFLSPLLLFLCATSNCWLSLLFRVWSGWSECQSITHLDPYSSRRPEVNRASILTPEDMGLCFASAVL